MSLSEDTEADLRDLLEALVVITEVLYEIHSFLNLTNESSLRFDNLISSVQVLVDEQASHFEVVGIPADSSFRYSYLNVHLQQLFICSILQNDVPEFDEQNDVAGDTVSKGESHESIEAHALSYKYKKIQSYANDTDADECKICLHNMEDGQDTRCLPCFHAFHLVCADGWLKISKTCPMCRLSISEEHKDFPLHFKDPGLEYEEEV